MRKTPKTIANTDCLFEWSTDRPLFAGHGRSITSDNGTFTAWKMYFSSYSRIPVERPPSPTTISLIRPYFVWRTVFSVSAIPDQRPSLRRDQRPGQMGFSPSRTTTSPTVYFQGSRVAVQHPFPMVYYYNVASATQVASATATRYGLSRGLLGLEYDRINISDSDSVVPRHLSSNWIYLNFLLFWQQRSQIDVESLRCCQPAGTQTHLYQNQKCIYSILTKSVYKVTMTIFWISLVANIRATCSRPNSSALN